MLKKTNYPFVVCLILFFSALSGALSAQPMRGFEKREQRYVYDVSYKKIAVGKITRELQQKGSMITANTTAELSFLFYRFGGNQLSQIYWDRVSHSYINKQFVRKTVGFSGESLQAYFSESGHQASVIRDGKTYQFINKEEKIIDFNAITLQISEGIKSGQTHFEFYMQTSDSVEHYFFEVTGKEQIETGFGKLDTYRLEQTRKTDRTFIAWFAPEINYQMVKFHYKFNLLDLRGILTKHSDKYL